MQTPTETIRVTLEDGGRVLECPFHSALGEVLTDHSPSGFPYIGALVNNDVTSLSYPLEMDVTVKLLTMADPEGWPIYERSLAFLLAKAIKEVFPQAAFSVDYAMGDGLYCSFNDSPDNQRPTGITQEQLQQIQRRMQELVAADLPIERRKRSFADAVRRFTEEGQTDKLNLLQFRNPPRITLHRCGGFHDLAQGPLVPRTGVLSSFELIHYPPGFVLQMPDPDKGTGVVPFKDRPLLFRIFQEHKEWGRILGVTTVGRLNEIIVQGDIGEFVKIAEALHEKKVARIADAIAGQRGRVRIVLIAGPSSSGKTTFAKRLAIQLKVEGLHAVTISLDNYFVDLAATPRDSDGNPDFEDLGALDLDLFNRHIMQLIAGAEVDMPTFNFEAKHREYRGQRLCLAPDSVLLVEGIHGLDPQLTRMVPATQKFRIYVSALTQLSIDSHNRISTTDNRLIRRLVRDYRYRGHSALMTLRMWPSVRRGEERWIFPFQDQADATFNSALDYELAVLKPVAEPLLMQVKPMDREYAEARRLTAFLQNFLSFPDRDVPSTSVLREYIGRSSFRY
jgi:uridine kinase